MKSIALPILFVLLAAASCSAPGVRAYAGYMQTTMSGSAALDDNLGPVPSLPSVSVDDLGLGGEEGSPYARIEGDLGLIRLTVSGFTYEHEGTGTVSANFGGITIGTQVASKIDFASVKAALSFDIDLPYVRVSPGVQINYMTLKGEIAETFTSTVETFDQDLPVPGLFLQTEVDLDFMGVILDIAGMDADVDDVDGTFLDLEAIVYWRPTDMIEIMAGYRFVSMDVDGKRDADAFLADFTFDGWFIGGGINF